MHREYWPTTQWQLAKPEDIGMSPEKINELGSMINNKYSNLNGIAVIRKGYVVYERYYNGCGPLDVHNVASITKSVISALVGIAIDAGFIRSIDQKVLEFFPEYIPDSEDILKRTITLRHLLTMTAPFPFSWKEGNKRGQEPFDRLRRQRNWVAYILNLLGQGGQPGKFQYYTAGIHLLSAIITRTTGMCAREFANEQLFGPLGMRVIPDQKQSFGLEDVFSNKSTGWIKDPDGNSSGGFGLTLTLMDMARFGFLYLNKGRWDTRQIIPEKWIDESINPSVHLDLEGIGYNGYGYLWWLREDNGISSFSAMGDGGNVICCVPEKDLVVAIASKIVLNAGDRWPLIEKCITAAVD